MLANKNITIQNTDIFTIIDRLRVLVVYSYKLKEEL